MRDAQAKGRLAKRDRLDKRGGVKLTTAQVEALVAERRAGAKQQALADKYGICQPLVSRLTSIMHGVGRHVEEYGVPK